MKYLFDIDEARRLCGTENEIITRHCQLRMEKRGISLSDAEYTIMNGEIIEEYPDDYPFPSCLLLCTLRSNLPLHVVCSVDGGFLYIITVYYPTSDKFKSDYKARRKENSK